LTYGLVNLLLVRIHLDESSGNKTQIFWISNQNLSSFRNNARESC
jgi:hypothetical protein